MSEEVKKKITLPEDEPTHLFVLSMASLSIMYKLFTGEVYRNEVLSQEVTSLSKLPRDTDASYTRRLAAEQRDAATIADIYTTTKIKRPPNYMTALLIVFATVAIIAYGNYSGQLYAWEAGFGLYQGYIVVGILLLVAFFILLRYGRRRRRAKA